ncbi:hypothetical protein NDK50_22380 [Paraburkholderia bryophila]|uniref:hypothetical protein n=1 Tax=Paraburkholderia bryophila TaxID=420952 RepID=UPI00234B3C00|nr:hypothetical protein [Paraburkholderia bryophila]WCM23613.1 hypothetical protein NDK50_22380 [Paraburkholderia bryophila]
MLDLRLDRNEVRKRFSIVRHESGPSFEAQGATPIVLVAGCITKMFAFLIYVMAAPTVGEMLPAAFGLSGGTTVLLAHRWILVGTRKAFDRAVAQHHVVLEGHPPHIMKIARTFLGAGWRCCTSSCTLN